MYTLIKGRYASKFELEEWYTLEEALKLHALVQMETDIKNGQAEEIRAKSNT